MRRHVDHPGHERSARLPGDGNLPFEALAEARVVGELDVYTATSCPSER